MTDSLKAPADRGRRLLLGTGGAALALGATGQARAARPTTPTYAITATRYTTAADAFLPTTGDTYVLPLAQVVAGAGNGDSTLNADNSITINHAGTYRVMLSVSWSAGKGRDTALRSWGLRRRAAGSAALTTIPGGALTRVPDTDQHLASEDHPGSSTPNVVRFPAPPDGAHTGGTPYLWRPGTIALGASASVDVTMPVTGIVGPGDIAMPALSCLTQAGVGTEATMGLVLTAKVIAPDVVRVTLLNATLSPSFTVPQGGLQVLAWSATAARGGSGNSRTLLTTSTLKLNQGDNLYAVFSSLTPGDVMPAGPELYLQVEKWTQTS